ncbi:hypothetical protein [Rubripirellula obstinata]|uniref:hypothetical protein n=1 Tax=Rubripirellula obstinata TaxID=406547 RepID=UPI00122D0AEB|nr:hypothetical protein [Rubripirellula obstinata]
MPKFSRRRLSTGFAAETQPAVNVTLCREDGVYEAGGELTAKWQIRRISANEIQSVEVSVMWHTEGKGDEDLHVHHFHRISESQIRRLGIPDQHGVADHHSLQCKLPASPLSYHGHLIHLRWCLRLRLFLVDGREILAEQPFHLVSPGSYPIKDSTAGGKLVTRRLPTIRGASHSKGGLNRAPNSTSSSKSIQSSRESK